MHAKRHYLKKRSPEFMDPSLTLKPEIELGFKTLWAFKRGGGLLVN